MEKVIDAFAISNIHIDGAHFNEIHIVASNTKTIQLKATVAGETFENVLLKTEQVARTFNIAAGFTPFFKAHDDKLAAHKVLSLRLDVVIPEGMQLDVKADEANIALQGLFKTVNSFLASGNYLLSSFEGSGTISTQNGGIQGTVSSRVLVVAVNQNSNPPKLFNKAEQLILSLRIKGGEIAITQTK